MCFQPPSLIIGKGLGTSDALLSVTHTLQSALESGQEARIVQIDFSAAFDRVNHQGILYKLSSVGIGISVLSVLTKEYRHSTLLLLLLKKIGNARPGEGDCHPISPKTPDPHYQPIEEKKRKGK